MLDLLYSDAWKLGFKVSLAVIPYVRATRSRFIPPEFRGKGKVFSISENTELIHYLLKRIEEGYVDIVQHGYSHEWVKGKPEFAVNDFAFVNERLKSGNRLLRKAFKREIGVFVAPYEKLSRATWKSIKANGMCLRNNLVSIDRER